MAVTNLPVIQQQMIRYGMTVYLALGLVGNICNCIMFTHYSHHRTASSIYFLALSIFAIIYLILSVVPLIYTLNHIDPQTQSLFYCKAKFYGIHVLGLFLRYIIVFACADRFFATRTNVRIRSLNSVQMAMKFVFIICGVSVVIGIHILIFMTIRGGVCGMFGVYKFIYAIYQITISSILPPILMCIFSILTIHSLHQRHGNQVHARQRDRYLLRMVIAEVIVNVFTSIPFSANLIYGAVTYNVVNKSAQRLEIESFMSFVTQFLIFLISVAPFYLFILTSKPFRNEFMNILVNGWYKYILRRVRVVPLNDQTNAAIINGRVMHDRH
jgi:hypothetical protein